MTFVLWGLAAVVAGFLGVVLVPRYLLKNAQDRLAGAALAREGENYKVLTRADLVAGRFRRVPGVLGLTPVALQFSGLFGESLLVETSNIQKIVTGSRLASGRKLVGLEVLRVTRSDGGDAEFVLSPASAFVWRSHLGLWAVEERRADADRVEPGR
ncbi:MAG TPA: hypothetical protein VJ776_04255 [Thermoanaerobaculia bacterium]|nr:hypothetical protein [Thermoanaerobaculia bacterium]